MDLHVGRARVEFPPGSTSTKKSGLSRSFFAFMGKDATHHRRPYTSRTPGRSTPNAGRSRKHQPSIPRLLEHRGTRRCRRASHCRRERRGAPTAKAAVATADASDRAVTPTIPSFDIAARVRTTLAVRRERGHCRPRAGGWSASVWRKWWLRIAPAATVAERRMDLLMTISFDGC
jgi:hypothetical protein